MTRWLHAIEPLIWPIFGAGFFAVAFVFPSFAAVVGLCDLAGWLPADYQVSIEGRFFSVRRGGGGTERSALVIQNRESAGSITSSISK